MMLDCRFVPIDRWPASSRSNGRKRAIFRVEYSKRLKLLEKELNHLHASDILIQLYLSPSDIRNDGWPRSGATPRSPGVVLTFKNRKKESLSFPCDTYTHWEDNLYAIALSLESLRAVDRYGVTRSEEQYQGWKRLAAPVKDRGWALTHLAALTNVSVQQCEEDLEIAFRTGARLTHPDHGGSVEAFQEFQDAINILRR